MKKRTVAAVLCLVLALSGLSTLSGCVSASAASDLMAGIKPSNLTSDVPSNEGSQAAADFAVSLIKSTISDDENTLVSPLSILCALAMTANGAQGETKAQMEAVLGLPVDQLNAYLHAYLQALPAGEKYKLSAANSIWFKDDAHLSVDQEFLQTNADYYGASIYKAPFDQGTLKDINTWVGDNTDGMIPNILDQIPEDAVMYLINALAFDAEWEEIYKESQVRKGTFTTQDGQAQTVDMMYGSEYSYLETEGAAGFIKYYADRKYAFAALLPDEGTTVSDFLASLTGEELMDTLNNPQNTKIVTAIPKFESEYEIALSAVLQAMGMQDAFEAYTADFTGIGKYEGQNIFISEVLHKTYIALDEKGTRAGAVTAVEMDATSASMEEPKVVHLDRPFVYMLIDCETSLPVFFGTVMQVG